MKQSAGSACESHIHVRDPQFDGSVGSLLGEVDVVYADDFSAAGVDNLLVQQILAHGEPALIGAVVLQFLFFDVQLQDAGGHERKMIVACDKRKEFPTSKQHASDAVGLIGRLDKKFGDVAYKMAILVIGLAA